MIVSTTGSFRAFINDCEHIINDCEQNGFSFINESEHKRDAFFEHCRSFFQAPTYKGHSLSSLIKYTVLELYTFFPKSTLIIKFINYQKMTRKTVIIHANSGTCRVLFLCSPCYQRVKISSKSGSQSFFCKEPYIARDYAILLWESLQSTQSALRHDALCQSALNLLFTKPTLFKPVSDDLLLHQCAFKQGV